MSLLAPINFPMKSAARSSIGKPLRQVPFFLPSDPGGEKRFRCGLIALEDAFGYGRTDYPHYPWMLRISRDERIVGPVARAMQLEEKAVTWLDRVVMRQRNGVPT